MYIFGLVQCIVGRQQGVAVEYRIKVYSYVFVVMAAGSSLLTISV